MAPQDSTSWLDDPTAVGTGLPLEGMRVLDLSRVLAGPLCAMIAADLGADVIKVEQHSGDPVRAMAPPSVDGDATYYLAVNRNRRSIVVDLTTAEGRALVGDLARQADAVVENFLPSQAEQLGIAALRSELTEVVWVTISPATSGGPLADLPSFDLLAQARSGIMGVTGTPVSGPMKVGAPIADVVTGLYACIGLLAGLLARLQRPSDPAHRVEAPLLESMMASLINQAAGYLATGNEPVLLGNEHPSIAPYAPYPAADGDVLVAVGTERQWRELCAAMEATELADDPRFSDNARRVANRAAMRTELEARFATKTIAEWLGRFEAANVPCAPVNTVAAAFAQEQITNGDLVQDVTLATGATIKMVGSPLVVDGHHLPIRRRPPLLGEHTDEIAHREEEER